MFYWMSIVLLCDYCSTFRFYCWELGEAGELRRFFLCLTACAVGDTSYCDYLRPSNVVFVKTDTGIEPFLLPMGPKEFLVFSISRLPCAWFFSLDIPLIYSKFSTCVLFPLNSGLWTLYLYSDMWPLMLERVSLRVCSLSDVLLNWPVSTSWFIMVRERLSCGMQPSVSRP